LLLDLRKRRGEGEWRRGWREMEMSREEYVMEEARGTREVGVMEEAKVKDRSESWSEEKV
jgi:hypothetical protein